MKYFANKMNYAEIEEAMEKLKVAEMGLCDNDHKINFYEKRHPKTLQYRSAVLEAPKIAEEFQDALFQLVDLKYLVGRVGSELLDTIAEEHPDWIDKKACDLMSKGDKNE